MDGPIAKCAEERMGRGFQPLQGRTCGLETTMSKKKKKNLLNAICLGTEMQVLARTSAARAAHSDLGTCRHL